MKKLLLTLALCGAAGAAVHAQIANPGMESWHTYTSGFLPPVFLQSPDNWYSTDSLMANFSILIGGNTNQQVFKSTDAHSGSFAAKIMTRPQGTLGILPGALMNAQPNFDLMDTSVSFTGGTSIGGWVDSVYAWVKYQHPGEFPEDDTAQMTAIAVRAGMGTGNTDSIVGMGMYMIMPTASYMKAGLKMEYTSPLQPDKIIIIFTSSPFSMGNAFGTTALDSSTLYVDDVSMVMSPLGVPSVCFPVNGVVVYPNPAHENLNISAAAANGPLTAELYNTAGQRVAQQSFERTTSIRTADFAAGLYFYQVKDQQGRMVKVGKVQVGR